MPRKSRMCYESGYFHIMVQGIEKKYIYEDNFLKKEYIKFVEEAAKLNKVEIIVYCIMDNHAHYLVYTENSQNMSKVMASANTKFAKLYNKYKKRCGYVFRDRYRCENIYTREYLKKCIRYIIQNPVKAGICENAELYPYSKYIPSSIDKIEEKEYFYDMEIKEEENNNFIDINNEFGNTNNYERPEKVLERLKYKKNDYERLPYIVNELEKNCQMTKTDIAKILGINRSKMYRILKKVNK